MLHSSFPQLEPEGVVKYDHLSKKIFWNMFIFLYVSLAQELSLIMIKLAHTISE